MVRRWPHGGAHSQTPTPVDAHAHAIGSARSSLPWWRWRALGGEPRALCPGVGRSRVVVLVRGAPLFPSGFAGEADIFDTWFTSSLTPQIGSHWGEDAERHAKLFPADVRPQAHEIIRTWAFYTIAKAMLHEDSIPWHHVLISGWILDPDRKKMSKSKGNVVIPTEPIERYGADSVRYWAASARLGVDTAIDEQVYKIGKRLSTKLGESELSDHRLSLH